MKKVDEFCKWVVAYLDGLGYESDFRMVEVDEDGLTTDCVVVEFKNPAFEASFTFDLAYLPDKDIQRFVASRLYLVMIGIIRDRIESVDGEIELGDAVDDVLSGVEDLHD